MSWIDALAEARDRGEASVLVTIESVEGSAPRGVGARLLLTRHAIADTIGGGALERVALERAQALLACDAPQPVIVRQTWTLGKALSQCCGGRATLSFAWTPSCDLRLEVFGAGHVAQEVARIARRLPCIATVHDPRIDWLARLHPDTFRGPPAHPSAHVATQRLVALPDIDLDASAVPRGGPGRLVAAPLGADVHAAVQACRPGAFFLVMTHSHELDLEICEAVLSRDDIGFLGLIASRSKATRFRSRLARQGFSASEIERLQAPLGQQVRTGDSPMEVAVAAMADVLSARERMRDAHGTSVHAAVVEDPVEQVEQRVPDVDPLGGVR